MGQGKFYGRGSPHSYRGRPQGRARGTMSDGEADHIDSEELTDLQQLAVAVQDHGPPRTRSEPPRRPDATHMMVNRRGAAPAAMASTGQPGSSNGPSRPPPPIQIMVQDSQNPEPSPGATTLYREATPPQARLESVMQHEAVGADLSGARQEALQAAAQDNEYELTIQGRPVHDSQGRMVNPTAVEEFIAQPNGGFQTAPSTPTHTAQTQSVAPSHEYVPQPLDHSTQPWQCIVPASS